MSLHYRVLLHLLYVLTTSSVNVLVICKSLTRMSLIKCSGLLYDCFIKDGASIIKIVLTSHRIPLYRLISGNLRVV